MKKFNLIFMSIILIMFVVLIEINIYVISIGESRNNQYRVDAKRVAQEIEEYGLENVDLSKYKTIVGIEEISLENNDDDLKYVNNEYVIKFINNKFYRVDYIIDNNSLRQRLQVVINITLGSVILIFIVVMLYIRNKILKPFFKLRDVPYELSKGNLTVPIKENKGQFFGRFVWGMNLLRENIEEGREEQLKLQRDKKMLVLSISHDIKTPLSAIKLYAKALERDIYDDVAKKAEVAANINRKADEIGEYISQIIEASSEDFLKLTVKEGEFYLKDVIDRISVYYKEKLGLLRTDFKISQYSNCILKGDIDRAVEVLQNIIENAIKYGDGRYINIEFADEENCKLVKVTNSGCDLSSAELPHIFDSFWRGSNVGGNKGSGLGLYICRQLMNKMGGEIFANSKNEEMSVTCVFVKM